MPPDTLPLETGLAVLVGAVVLPGAFFGLLRLGQLLGVSGDGPFFVSWVGLTIVVAALLVLGTSGTGDDLLAGLTLGIATAFVGIPALLGRPGVVIVASGLFATVAVFLGTGIGLLLRGDVRNGAAFTDDPRSWGVAVGFVLLVALATLVVDATTYWYQNAPEVYQIARWVLFAGVLLAGVLVPATLNFSIQTYVTAIALHPFLVYIWVFQGPFPVDEITMRTAVIVTGLLLVGATVSVFFGERDDTGKGSPA